MFDAQDLTVLAELTKVAGPEITAKFMNFILEFRELRKEAAILREGRGSKDAVLGAAVRAWWLQNKATGVPMGSVSFGYDSVEDAFGVAAKGKD